MSVTKFTLFAVVLVVLVSAATAQFGILFDGPGFGRPGYGSFGPGFGGGFFRPGLGGGRPGFGGFRPGYGQVFGPGFDLFRRR